MSKLDDLWEEYGLENWTYKDEAAQKILAAILAELPEKEDTLGVDIKEDRVTKARIISHRLGFNEALAKCIAAIKGINTSESEEKTV